MELVLDENKNAVLREGKPVYRREDGSEIELDAARLMGSLSNSNGESAARRKRIEELESDNKRYEGISDPEAARKALEIVKNLDAKKLIDAGEVERIKDELSKGYDAKFAPIVAERDTLKVQLEHELIGGKFARSAFVAGKLIAPADMVQATFRDHFRVEDGKVVCTGANGQQIFSRKNMGEVADFEEALEIIVNDYPNKDLIMKPATQSGPGGGKPGDGGPGFASKTLSECKTSEEKIAWIKANTK